MSEMGEPGSVGLPLVLVDIQCLVGPKAVAVGGGEVD